MNLEQLRARLAEIATELKAIDVSADGATESVNALHTEFETVKGSITTLEKIAEVETHASASAGRAIPPVNPSKPNASASAPRKMDNGTYGFDTQGEFFMSVKSFHTTGSRDKRLNAAVQEEKTGEAGGFLVPEDIRMDIQKKVEGDESLLSRCRQFNVTGNRYTTKIDESAPWSGSGSNIQAYWVDEGEKITKSAKKFKELDIKCHKLAALVPATEEMLEDSAMLESTIRNEAPEVIMQMVNEAIISGNGVGKPQGILNSGFGVEVAKKAGQSADTIVFDNVKKLFARLLPKAQRDAIYLYNAEAAEQLIGMQLHESSVDSPSVYLPNQSIDGAPYGTLWNRPVFPMLGSMSALGDKGDIIAADLSYYYAILKVSGIKQSISTHVYFETDETAFKFTFRVGGQCPFKSPVETQKGAYQMSGFTYLEDRA